MLREEASGNKGVSEEEGVIKDLNPGNSVIFSKRMMLSTSSDEWIIMMGLILIISLIFNSNGHHFTISLNE